MIKNTDRPIDGAVRFLIKRQVSDSALWARLVDQFRSPADRVNNYRGEYWGKIMRGAALLYKYSRDEALYAVLERTVSDLLSTQKESGKISAYVDECELQSWDMWCRKYVAVGLEYFYDVCRSEDLRQKILSALKRHLDYIVDRIGDGENKTSIFRTTNYWGGLNSCSVLKAFVILYEKCGDRKYLDFAKYIVDSGCIEDFNIFEASYRNESPSSFRYTKAYEMTSCYEGLLEYAKVTRDERAKEICIRYGNKILEEEFTVAGSGACNTECYNFSRFSQTIPRKKPMQETCVTVSYLLYFNELFSATGDTKYLDAMELSFYNAYLGALNENDLRKTDGLPVDWYSPLVRGSRRNKVVGGRQTFPQGGFYSCCTAIAPVGAGLIADRIFSVQDDDLTINFYQSGTFALPWGVVSETADYPKSGVLSFRVTEGATERATLSFRIPRWCTSFSVRKNGSLLTESPTDGYLSVTDAWKAEDELELVLETPYLVHTIPQTDYVGGLFYVTKGPIVFAEDKRFASLNTVVVTNDFHDAALPVSFVPTDGLPAYESVDLVTDKNRITLIDYASAGSTYSPSSALNVFIPYCFHYPLNVLKCRLARNIVR